MKPHSAAAFRWQWLSLGLVVGTALCALILFVGCGADATNSGTFSQRRHIAVAARVGSKSFCSTPARRVSLNAAPTLALSRKTFTSGQTAWLKVVNGGRRKLAFEVSPVVQVRSDGSWSHLPITRNGAPLSIRRASGRAERRELQWLCRNSAGSWLGTRYLSRYSACATYRATRPTHAAHVGRNVPPNRIGDFTIGLGSLGKSRPSR